MTSAVRRAPEWAACPAFLAGFADRTLYHSSVSALAGSTNRTPNLEVLSRTRAPARSTVSSSGELRYERQYRV